MTANGRPCLRVSVDLKNLSDHLPGRKLQERPCGQDAGIIDEYIDAAALRSEKVIRIVGKAARANRSVVSMPLPSLFPQPFSLAPDRRHRTEATSTSRTHAFHASKLSPRYTTKKGHRGRLEGEVK